MELFNKSDLFHVNEVSGGFEYFHLRFGQGGVPSEVDSVPDRIRRSLSDGILGCYLFANVGP